MGTNNSIRVFLKAILLFIVVVVLESGVRIRFGAGAATGPVAKVVIFTSGNSSTAFTTAHTTASFNSTASSSATNCIIVSIQTFNGGTYTITDNISPTPNTYTAVSAGVTSGSTRVKMYYCLNPILSATHTITVTSSGSDYVSIDVIGISGASASPLDGSPTTNTTSTATTIAPGSITPSTTNTIMIGTWCDYVTTTSSTISGGFTIAAQRTFLSLHTLAGGTFYLIQSSATAQNPTVAFGSTTSESSIIMQNFK